MRLGLIPQRCLPGLAAVAVLALVATPVTAQPKRTRAIDYNNYVKQLTARFNAWDTNGDKVLDKNELARAFRGTNAKAYDANEDKTPPALKASFDTDYLNILKRMTPFTIKGVPPLNYTLADLLARDLSNKNTPNLTNYNTLPDYQFILIVGTTGQPKLTKKEYDSWARTYAGQVADLDEANRKLAAAQAKFNKAKKPVEKQKYMAEVIQYQQQVLAAANVVSTTPAQIRQKLAGK